MIQVVGIGPGSPNYLLSGFETWCERADRIYGYPRQLGLVASSYQDKLEGIDSLSDLPQRLQQALDQGEEVLVLASGDPSCYGIARYLISQLGSDCVQVEPGISSVQYLFARLGLSMNDCYLTSSHGRKPDFDRLAHEEKLAMVTDDQWGPYQISQELVRRGVRSRNMAVGEALTYPEEAIHVYALDQVPDRDYLMNVVIIYD